MANISTVVAVLGVVVVFDLRVGQPEFINVGPGTAPETWKFIGNAWFDTEGNRQPTLPGTETGSVYQVDPELVDIGQPTMRITSADERLKDVGARAWKKLDAGAWTAGEQLAITGSEVRTTPSEPPEVE